MSKNENKVIREASGKFIEVILNNILQPIREVAYFNGYAIAVHGSLKRDIDLVAIPWTEQSINEEKLVQLICGAISGVLGNCVLLSGPVVKPHNRVAYTLVHPGFCGEIDLSIVKPNITF